MKPTLTQLNPTLLRQTQTNPAQPNPTQPNPTQLNETHPNQTQPNSKSTYQTPAFFKAYISSQNLTNLSFSELWLSWAELVLTVFGLALLSG